jgi:aspartate aminotransferase
MTAGCEAMDEHAVSRRAARLLAAMRPFADLMMRPELGRLVADPHTCNFLAGNPQEVASPEYVDILQRWVLPRDKDWFAYKMPDPTAQAAAAEGLSRELGLAFEPQDILLARGAHGGLATALGAVVEPGDEVLFVSPPWFFYEAIILGTGATPVRVRVNETTFDLDLSRLQAAVCERTRAVIINTPHNPTGKIYPPATLEHLAAILTTASSRYGRPIYLVSDESYSRILFDGNRFHTPAHFYPYTFLVHTYSKSALAPGQRLGFVALPPTMPDREFLRMAFLAVGLALGTGVPDAIMQYALPDIERLQVDLEHLQRKRDRLLGALLEQGYQVHRPEGTFYLLPRCPVPDDGAFAERLARDKVAVLPGRAVEMPGYMRLSLTATDAMIERALPVFAAAIRGAHVAA